MQMLLDCNSRRSGLAAVQAMRWWAQQEAKLVHLAEDEVLSVDMDLFLYGKTVLNCKYV